MEIVEKDGNFDSVLLHVQVNNDSAIKFYKRFGFDIVETKEQVCVPSPHLKALGSGVAQDEAEVAITPPLLPVTQIRQHTRDPVSYCLC